MRSRPSSASGFDERVSRRTNRVITRAPATIGPQEFGEAAEICALMRPAETRARPARASSADTRGSGARAPVVPPVWLRSPGSRRISRSTTMRNATRSNTKMARQSAKLTSTPPSTRPKGAPRVIATAFTVRARTCLSDSNRRVMSARVIVMEKPAPKPMTPRATIVVAALVARIPAAEAAAKAPAPTRSALLTPHLSPREPARSMNAPKTRL